MLGNTRKNGMSPGFQAVPASNGHERPCLALSSFRDVLGNVTRQHSSAHQCVPLINTQRLQVHATHQHSTIVYYKCVLSSALVSSLVHATLECTHPLALIHYKCILSSALNNHTCILASARKPHSDGAGGAPL
jgi:hypothetical protein